MKKLISYLYHRYCDKPIDNLLVGGIQREFKRILSEREVRERNVAVYNFIQTGWFEQIFNEHLKERVEVLLNMCETQKQRDYMFGVISDILKFEERFNSIGIKPDTTDNFDKFNL